MAKNLYEITEKLFGTRTSYQINPLVTKVQNTVTPILKADPTRLSVVIVNLGNVSMYISPDNNVSNAAGVLVAPNGGQVTMIMRDDMELLNQAWYAIANAPNTSIFIITVVSVGKDNKK